MSKAHSREVITPNGVYRNARIAAEAHNISHSTACRYIKSSKHPDWRYND